MVGNREEECIADLLGDEAVGTVRAGDGGHGAASIIVACVPGDSRGAGGGGEEGCSCGELHLDLVFGGLSIKR